MKKRFTFLITIFTICILFFIFCENSYAATNKSKSFSLIVSGAGVGNGDKDEMEKILQKNKLFSSNSIWTYTYDTEAAGIAAGTTKAEYDKAIDRAYKGCTTNDTAYFFHSGHGMEGITKGWGITLKTAYGGIPILWYKYDDLLGKLSGVPCKHMVVIIHACESGAVKEAYDKLPQSKKNKISLFWSSAANQLSYKSNALRVSVYGQTLIQLLGYDGNLYADTNSDGDVTVKELGNYINSYIGEVSKYVKAPTQTPGYTSAKNSNTVIYSYNSGGNKNTTKKASIKLNKSNVTIYTSGNKTVQLKATVKGTSIEVTWKSSKPSVASVNSKGKVTAKKVGTATITAKVNGVSASCRITVKKSPEENAVLNSYKKILSKKILSNSLVHEKFVIKNIVGDNLPELLVYGSSEGGWLHLYKYDLKKKKAVLIAHGTKAIYINKNRGRSISYDVIDKDYYVSYCISNFDGKELEYYTFEDGKYYKGDLRISKEKYKADINEYIKGAKKYVSKDVTYINNKANRSKYLK